MSRLELAPRGDGWGLPLAGQQVTRVWLDNESVGLLCRNSVQLSIAEPFMLTSPEGIPARLDPSGRPGALAPALTVLRQVIREGTAFRDGRLELAFADGTQFSVPASTDYEAWMLAGPGGPDGLKVVSMPGGDLAIWDDKRPPGTRPRGTSGPDPADTKTDHPSGEDGELSDESEPLAESDAG